MLALTPSLIFLFTLFLRTAFLETFCETTKPILVVFKLFLTVFKIKKSFARSFPFLSTLSKSFFLFNLCSFGNTLLRFNNLGLNSFKPSAFFSFFSFGGQEFSYLPYLYFFLKIRGSFFFFFFLVDK